MSLLTNMQSLATRMLSDKGESVTFSRVSGGVKNAATGQTTGTTTSSFSAYAHPSPYKESEINETTIERGDIRVLVDSQNGTPATGDECTFRSEDYRVMSVMPLSVQGGDAAYKVQLRK